MNPTQKDGKGAEAVRKMRMLPLDEVEADFWPRGRDVQVQAAS